MKLPRFEKFSNQNLQINPLEALSRPFFLASFPLIALVKNAAITTIETAATTVNTIIAEVSFPLALFAI